MSKTLTTTATTMAFLTSAIGLSFWGKKQKILPVANAENENMQICENQSVPDGYVITARGISSVRCGNWQSEPNRWIPFTEMRINKIGADRMRICDGQSIPRGYVVTQRGLSSTQCGSWRSGQNSWKPYTETEIKRLTS